MATSLTGQNVNTTYDSLIKVGDNGPITSTAKQLSDGLGNEFPMKASLTEVQITGSLFGTSSWARNAVSSSYILNAVSASFATSASNARTASFAVNATNAQFADLSTQAQTLEWTSATANANYPLSLVNNAFAYSEHYVDTNLVFNPSSNVLTLTGSLRVSGSITGSILGTASFATNALSASHALTASYTPNAITSLTSDGYTEVSFYNGNGTLNSTLEINPRVVLELVKNKETTTLAKGTPVYVSGSTGNAANVYRADAGSAATMPAAYVLNESLAADAEGLAILNGYIDGVNTSTFQAGQAVYVAVGGGYTNVKPTGSALIQKLGNVINSGVNGSGVITGAGRSNDIPNIAAGNVWVGNSDQVPVAVSTASLLVNTASFATTASYAVSASVATSATLATLAAAATSATSANTLDLTSTTSNVNYRLVLATGTGTGQILYADSEPASIAWNASTNRLNISGAISASAVTSSLFGTASWANNAVSASNALTASFVRNAVTASYVLNAVSSSFATTASHALNGGVTSIIAGTGISVNQSTGAVTITNTGGGGGSTDTGSLLRTASVNLNTITFTKGDGSTFPITVNTGSGGGGPSYITPPFDTGSILYWDGTKVTGSDDVAFYSADDFRITAGYFSVLPESQFNQLANFYADISVEGGARIYQDTVADAIVVEKAELIGTTSGSYGFGSHILRNFSTTGPTLTPGRIVYISGSGQWAEAVASSTGSSTGVLGVVTTNANQNNVLLSGMVRVSQSLAGFTNGRPVYLATSSNGTITQTPPSTAGHVARYVGYVIDSGSRQIYFNPDFTYVEL